MHFLYRLWHFFLLWCTLSATILFSSPSVLPSPPEIERYLLSESMSVLRTDCRDVAAEIDSSLVWQFDTSTLYTSACWRHSSVFGAFLEADATLLLLLWTLLWYWVIWSIEHPQDALIVRQSNALASPIAQETDTERGLLSSCTGPSGWRYILASSHRASTRFGCRFSRWASIYLARSIVLHKTKYWQCGIRMCIVVFGMCRVVFWCRVQVPVRRACPEHLFVKVSHP